MLAENAKRSESVCLEGRNQARTKLVQLCMLRIGGWHGRTSIDIISRDVLKP